MTDGPPGLSSSRVEYAAEDWINFEDLKVVSSYDSADQSFRFTAFSHHRSGALDGSDCFKRRGTRLQIQQIGNRESTATVESLIALLTSLA
jgi:hypothetical protein